MPSEVRITVAVARVLREFLSDVAQPRYGYDLMRATGYQSGKLYPILARLQHAGWLTREAENVDAAQARRPPRYLYQLSADGAGKARLELAELTAQLSVSPAAAAPAGSGRQCVSGLLIALLAVVWAVVIGVPRAAISDMATEEARTRLSRIPLFLIRLAVARMPPELRGDVGAEWKAELEFVVGDTEGMPLTRLLRGIRYSAGLLFSAAAITDGLTGASAKRVARIIRIVIGSTSAVLGAGGVAAGITLMAIQGMPAAEFIGGTCMAMCYATGGIQLALARWQAWPLAAALACSSNIAFYLYHADVSRLLWAGGWFLTVLFCAACRLMARQDQLRYERLLQEHSVMFPDCAECFSPDPAS